MKQYHSISAKEVISEFQSSIHGLSQKEASLRIKKYGYNKLPEAKKLSLLTLFIDQFKNPLIYILFFALIVSFSTRHYTDGWIILAVVLISTLVGFLQEYKSQ